MKLLKGSEGKGKFWRVGCLREQCGSETERQRQRRKEREKGLGAAPLPVTMR